MNLQQIVKCAVLGVVALVLASTRAAEPKPTGAQPEVSFLNKSTHQKWGRDVPDWTRDVPGFQPPEAGEHPRIVCRKGDVARLKQRAEATDGKAIVERLKKLLEGKPTLSHPAGYGLLYQLTGDKQYAERAKEMVADILDKKLADSKDPRYAFYRGGRDPEMRVGPAVWIMGLSYDLNYDGWDEAFRKKVALAIEDNPLTAKIASHGPIGPGCNHFGAAVGGVGAGLLAIRNDPGIDAKKVEDMLACAVKQVREDIAAGRGNHGYFFEGHQCGRISSNTGVMPFLQAYRTAAGKDMVSGIDNARWIAGQWVYEFARNPDGSYTDAQRGMYCRDFPRGKMWPECGDFAEAFGVCFREFVPALKWVYENQVEPGEPTFDIIDYPAQAVYALANWPIGVKAVSPVAQPDLFPRVEYDAAAGHLIFRNGWAGKEDKGDKASAGSDICVSALLGTHPQNGRGMAAGGSVYVYGKGLGWSGDRPKYTLPGAFFACYPTYLTFEPDGSGVVSAKQYKDRVHNNQNGATAPGATDEPTSLAVDFSGASGAECLVAMAGPLVGKRVEYWMDGKPAKIADVKGQDGYETKTVTNLKLGGKNACVMTLRKGVPPEVRQDGDAVRVGNRLLTFDGEKIVLGK